VPDRFIAHASRNEMYQEVGIDAASVAAVFTSDSPSQV